MSDTINHTKSAPQTSFGSTNLGRESQLTRTGKYLFFTFCIYLVIPIIDIPLLGLSLSAPVMFLVFLEVFLKSNASLNRCRRWLHISYFLMLGFLISLVGNAVFRGIEIGDRDILTLIRYGYWITAFLTTSVIISTNNFLIKIGPIIAAAIVILAILRLYEAVAFGRWGAWTNSQFLTQNSYGIQFSTFFPFALIPPIILKGWKRRLSIVALFATIIAVAGNGSRSSWIAVVAGAILFVALYVFAYRTNAATFSVRLTSIIAGLLLIVVMLPQDLMDPILSRMSTFDSLNTDKSYMIRELMIQKGLRLFEESPLLGVGVGRFAVSTVPLDIPDVLDYANQDRFDNRSAHNSYVSLLGETGLIGIFPFIILHLGLFIRGLPAAIGLSRSGNPWGIAIFCGYVGMSLHLWSLSGLTGTAPWYIYGLVAGMIEYEQYTRAYPANRATIR